jgi:hypothetical protein
MDSVIEFKISDPEYAGMYNDIARFAIIQLSIQFMLVLVDPQRFSIFSGEFVLLLIYMTIGVMMYWLVWRKFVSIR